VPAEFVPGRFWLLFAALPTPLGSLPVLKPPAGLAGPVTPLIAVVPAPGEPALGAAVTPPVAAPAPDAPPDEAPPLEPPPAPPPPPPPCAKPGIGASNNVVASKYLTVHPADMAISLLTPTPLQSPRSSEPEGFALGISDGSTQAVPRHHRAAPVLRFGQTATENFRQTEPILSQNNCFASARELTLSGFTLAHAELISRIDVPATTKANREGGTDWSRLRSLF
jgi:hypothetical protein